MVRDGGVQRRRIDELAELRPVDRHDAVDELATLLSGESAYVRARAMDLLVELSEEYPGALTGVSDEVAGLLGDDALGDGAARVLENLATEEPGAVADRLPLLVAVIDSGGAVTEHVTAALAALGADSPERLAQPGILDQLVDLLDDDTEAVRRNVTGALGDIASAEPGAVVDADAGTGLRERLGDDSPAVQRNAAYGLGQLAEASPPVVFDAIDDLCGLLESPDPGVRAAAAHALGASVTVTDAAGDDAIATVMGHLDAEAPTTRQQAAFVLAKVATRDPHAVRSHLGGIARGMVDSDLDVRRNLGHALRALETAVPDAVETATTEVSEWLGTVDTNENTGVSRDGLRGLANDENAPPELRQAARSAVVLDGQHAVRPGTGPGTIEGSGREDSARVEDDQKVDRGTQSCPECGETFESDATFCSVCGTSLD